MKAIIKVFGILLGLVLIVCAGALIYISTLNPNDYKGLISEKFQEENNRTLSIDGDISITIYPWLGLEISGVTVGNAPGFRDSPFLHVDNAMLRMKFMPLLRKQYEIDTVRLYGLSLNLEKNQDGVSNWQDLIEEADGRGDTGGGDISLAAIILGGVDVRDGSFSWNDQVTGARYGISSLMMSTGELVYGEPIQIELSLNATSNQPELTADTSLSGTIIYDLDNEIYDISPLQFRTVLSGPNVPQNATDITLQSDIRINLDDETMTVSNLDFNALGAQFSGTVNASDIKGDEPSLQTQFNLSGEDLALLFKVAEIEPLATQLAGLADRSYTFSTAIDVNMENQELAINGLRGSLLGANITADLNARNIRSESPAILGTVNASGPDLPTLLQVMGQLSGGRDSSLSQLAVQLKNSANRSFNLSAEIDADMDDGDVDISGLQANLLGAEIMGDIEASGIKSSSPSYKGTINASGPNLPSLMQLLGQFQGGAESALAVYGKQFNTLSNKSFVVDTRFDVDMSNGDINLPALSIEALGMRLNGNVVASNMQSNNGNINGQLAMTGNRMGELLAAMDHADLGEVLQSMDLNAAINGTRTDLNISPLDLKLLFSGVQGQTAPVQLALNATTRLNLEQETLALNNFKVSGLGMNLAGNLSAEKFLESPAFKGDVEVAPFSLRRLMTQLNQELPETADNKVFENVSLTSAFEGSSGHLNISRLAMVLDESKLDGSFSMTDFDNPAIEFGINIDQINADRYLAPEAADGGARPITPETAAGAAAQLPLETLRALNTRGELKIGQLVISKAKMSDVVLAMNAKDGKINLSPVAANLYQGNYSGNISLDASSDIPLLSLDSSLKAIEIDPFMMDFSGASNISGTGNMDLKLTARGIDNTSMISTMNGTGNIALENGVLQGVDVAKVMAQVQIMIETRRALKIDRGEQTPFDTFTSTVTVTNGVVNSNDLQISSPGILITGKGTVINMNTNNLNYNLVASAEEGTATRGEEEYNIGGYSIPIKCTGSVNDPNCIPDVGEIIKVAVQREVQRQIGNVLQRALGVEQPVDATTQPAQPSGTTTQPAQPSGTTTQPQQQPAQPVDPAQEILNKALESIFR